jgi:hypothetical protein
MRSRDIALIVRRVSLPSRKIVAWPSHVAADVGFHVSKPSRYLVATRILPPHSSNPTDSRDVVKKRDFLPASGMDANVSLGKYWSGRNQMLDIGSYRNDRPRM